LGVVQPFPCLLLVTSDQRGPGPRKPRKGPRCSEERRLPGTIAGQNSPTDPEGVRCFLGGETGEKFFPEKRKKENKEKKKRRIKHTKRKKKRKKKRRKEKKKKKRKKKKEGKKKRKKRKKERVRAGRSEESLAEPAFRGPPSLVGRHSRKCLTRCLTGAMNLCYPLRKSWTLLCSPPCRNQSPRPFPGEPSLVKVVKASNSGLG